MLAPHHLVFTGEMPILMPDHVKALKATPYLVKLVTFHTILVLLIFSVEVKVEDFVTTFM